MPLPNGEHLPGNGDDEEPIDTDAARRFAHQARRFADDTPLGDCIGLLADWVESMADEIDQLRRGRGR